MRVFIVEDEFAAQANLRRMLTKQFEDIEVAGVTDSVKGAVAWLRQNQTDIIFMDVELSDGTCFDIFKQVEVTAKVIITTAFDSYALRAFRINSVDYLLKPIDIRQLTEAIERCRKAETSTDNSGLMQIATGQPTGRPQYKQRYIVRLGDRILIIKIEDVAYFLSKEKTVYLVTKENRQYIVDQSLDMIESILDPAVFFRVTRACIANINAISGVMRHFSGRLKLQLDPALEDDLFVSRVRTNDFMRWLNQ
ncbi:MAG: response regulator transcription factor [Paludibacteraceae bacterium]|nr:response regulator transcription factor [Paludibacteraceae bacterium]